MRRYLYFSFLCFLVLFGCQKPNNVRVREISKIVFLSNRDAPKRQFDIYMMNPDGSNQINLTPDLRSINSLSHPILSPDGKKILFPAFNKKIILQLLNIDNRMVTDVVDVDYDVPRPSFSPQGDKILFVRKIDGRRQIFVVSKHGSAERHLSNVNYDEFEPAFSPDGTSIVFVSGRGGVYFLSIMNVDDANRKDIVQNSRTIRFPTFSPKGDLIAFNAYQNNVSGIYLIKCNGEGVKSLIQGKVVDTPPLFTPDASKIIFLSRQRGMKYADVCVIDKNGKHFKNLTHGLNYINKNARLTPDGKSIIFESIQFNNCDIYRIDVDGKNLVNLTNHPKWDQSPSL